MTQPKSALTKSLCVTAQSLKRTVPVQDFHLHTTQTDGFSSVADYFRSAQKFPRLQMAFTEHVNIATNWFSQFKSQVRSATLSYGIVLCGIEVRNADYSGQLNVKSSLIKQADLVLGVVHRYPHLHQPPPAVYEFSQLTPKQALELEEKSFLSLIQNPQVDIIGHPFASFTTHYGNFPPQKMHRLFSLAKQAGKVIEINPQYLPQPESFFAALLSVDPQVSLGSNAHHVHQLLHAYRFVKSYFNL